MYLLWFKEDSKVSEKSAINQAGSDRSQHRASSDRTPSPGRTSDFPRPSYAGSNSHGLGISGVRSTSPHDMRLIPTITHPDIENGSPSEAPAQHIEEEEEDRPTAGRPLVRQWFTKAANHLGNAAHQALDTSDYNDQRAHKFPEIPGETLRNPELEQISRQYSQLREERSKAESTYAASIASASGQEDGATPPPPLSPRMSPRTDTSPSRRPPRRRDTLEVPTPVHIHRRNESR